MRGRDWRHCRIRRFQVWPAFLSSVARIGRSPGVMRIWWMNRSWDLPEDFDWPPFGRKYQWQAQTWVAYADSYLASPQCTDWWAIGRSRCQEARWVVCILGQIFGTSTSIGHASIHLANWHSSLRNPPARSEFHPRPSSCYWWRVPRHLRPMR